MRRTLVVVCVVVAGLLMFRAGLAACGDKSLNAGGIRQQRAVAQQFPASILIYGPPTSRIADAINAGRGTLSTDETEEQTAEGAEAPEMAAAQAEA